MTTGRTPNLNLALPVQGELSGEWGNEVNNGLTDYVDIAIAGTLTLTGDGAVTLANTTGAAAGDNIGSTTAQYYILKVVGPLTATKVITGPSSSKTYIVNNTDSTYGVTIKASGQTGVTIAAGQRALVVFNGTDYVQVGASAGGSNTQVQYNNNGALAGSANFTFNGTTATINALNLTTALGVAYGGTGATTLTANNVILGNGTSAVQTVAPGTAGNVLTSNGTTWQSTALPASGVSKGQSIAFAMIFGL